MFSVQWSRNSICHFSPRAKQVLIPVLALVWTMSLVHPIYINMSSDSNKIPLTHLKSQGMLTSRRIWQQRGQNALMYYWTIDRRPFLVNRNNISNLKVILLFLILSCFLLFSHFVYLPSASLFKVLHLLPSLIPHSYQFLSLLLSLYLSVCKIFGLVLFWYLYSFYGKFDS